MGHCTGCGDEINDENLVGGQCGYCHKMAGHGATAFVPHSAVLVTTETSINIGITKRLEIVTSECVMGINIFRDVLTLGRDIFGGRSGTLQKALKEAKDLVIDGIKQEAYSLGANAVIALRLDYSEISGGGKGMVFVVASGTAVTLDGSVS